jgi:hypothetical protein
MELLAPNVEMESAVFGGPGIKTMASVFRKVQLPTVMGRLRAAKRANAAEALTPTLYYSPNPPSQMNAFSC